MLALTSTQQLTLGSGLTDGVTLPHPVRTLVPA